MLLDDTSKRASAGEGYQPGDNLRKSQNQGQSPDPDFEGYDPSVAPKGGPPTDYEDSGYESAKKENFNNPEFRAAQDSKNQDRMRLIEEAKKIMRRGVDRAPGRLATRLGAPKDIVKDLRSDNPESRERVKQYAKDKTREFVKEKIGQNIANEGIKKGFQKGVSQGAKKATQKATQQAGKKVAEAGAKKVAEGAAKQAVGKGVGTAVAGATGVETFGFGFILGFLINLAISLYLDDAIEAASELQQGNRSEALFFFIRAGAKVGIFLWFLIALLFLFTVAGVFISIPILLALNIYMIIGAIPATKRIPHLQGMVWWEMVVLIIIDLVAFLVVAAFIGGLVYYLCQSSGLGSGGITGVITSAVVTVYDWWNSSSAGSFANDICTQVLTH